MRARIHVPVTPSVLDWAMREGGYEPRTLAKRVGVTRDTVSEWLAGSLLPTQGEFTKLVETLKRPSAIFFLPKAPDTTIPPELRSEPTDGRPLGPIELQRIRRTVRLQRVLSEWLRESRAKPVDFPECDLNMKPAKAGVELRAALDVSVEEQLSWETAIDAFRTWRGVLSEKEIQTFLVQLGDSGVRGFSSWDDFLPIVGINTAYNPQARIFTVFHELAHLLARTQAACADMSLRGKRGGIERWCEGVASVALLPGEAVATVFDSVRDAKAFDQVRKVADAFSVSLRAAALRVGDLGLVNDPKGLYMMVDRNAGKWDRTKRPGWSKEPRTRAIGRISEVGAPVVSMFGQALSSGYLHEQDIRQYMRLEPREFEEAKSRLNLPT